jgi:hypothetical protein
MCRICYYKKKRPSLGSYMKDAEKTTTKAIDHLEDLYQFDRLGNKVSVTVSKKRKG